MISFYLRPDLGAVVAVAKREDEMAHSLSWRHLQLEPLCRLRSCRRFSAESNPAARSSAAESMCGLAEMCVCCIELRSVDIELDRASLISSC